MTAVKVYYPQDGQIQVHQSRVTECPPEFPAGFYWYGGKGHGPGRPPKWVEQLLSNEDEMSTEGDAGADLLVEDSDSEEHNLVKEDSVIEDNGTTPEDDGENIKLILDTPGPPMDSGIISPYIIAICNLACNVGMYVSREVRNNKNQEQSVTWIIYHHRY